jgi:hypothetical protein
LTLLSFYLIFFNLYRSIWIIFTYWIISASVALNWIVSLSRYFSLYDIFFVNLIRNIRVSLLLPLLFLIHYIFYPLFNLTASIAYVFHTYFNFLFTKWVLTFSWILHAFLWFSTIYPLTNVIHWVISIYSYETTFRNIISHLNIWIISWKRSILRFLLNLLISRRWPSH